MYSKYKALIDAHTIFNTMFAWNVVSWFVMINGYAQNERMDDVKNYLRTLLNEM